MLGGPHIEGTSFSMHSDVLAIGGDMDRTKFIIVGGGIVAGYAAKKLVELRLKPGELTIVSADTEAPYERPPLSLMERSCRTFGRYLSNELWGDTTGADKVVCRGDQKTKSFSVW